MAPSSNVQSLLITQARARFFVANFAEPHSTFALERLAHAT